MMPLHISTSDHRGGAARATCRLHEALLQNGISSRMLVFDKATYLPHIDRVLNLSSSLDTLKIRVGRKRNNWIVKRIKKDKNLVWNLNHTPTPIASVINRIAPSTIHIHWIGENFIPITTFKKLQAKLIWTFHDMWGMTGGCHYAGACTRYINSCGHCPQLRHSGENDLSAKIWRLKRAQWRDLPMTIIAPSEWMAERARQSPLFTHTPVHVIPNALDTQRFAPIPKSVARQLLGLTQNIPLIGTGALNANDPRKGFPYLQEALRGLSPDIGVAVLGATQPPALARPTFAYRLRDDISLVAYYSALDAFIAPSTTDNLPSTVMEAMACGVPCVAFNIGGMPDLISHQTNGYVATPFDTDELAQGIQEALANSASWGMAARTKAVATYDYSVVAAQHIQLSQQV